MHFSKFVDVQGIYSSTTHEQFEYLCKNQILKTNDIKRYEKSYTSVKFYFYKAGYNQIEIKKKKLALIKQNPH